MRRAIPLVSFCVMMVVGAACTRPTLPVTGKVVPVSVQITCAGDSMNASIFPYVAQVPDSDGVSWSLVASPHVTEFEIDKKKWNSPWPYGEKPPVKGNRERSASANHMKSGLVGRKFSYNISAICTAPNRDPRKIVIDPDLIIIRRPQQQ